MSSGGKGMTRHDLGNGASFVVVSYVLSPLVNANGILIYRVNYSLFFPKNKSFIEWKLRK
jgi:hypothetical protein